MELPAASRRAARRAPAPPVRHKPPASYACPAARSFASFAFAAQSLLSALGVVQFISNIIFGRFVNKEKVGAGGMLGGRAWVLGRMRQFGGY